MNFSGIYHVEMYTDQQYKELEEMLSASVSMYNQYLVEKKMPKKGYSVPCDILRLDEKIRSVLKHTQECIRNQILAFQTQLHKLNDALTHSPRDSTLLQEKKRLESELHSLERHKGNTNLHEYIYLSSKIIDEFQEQLKKPKKISFFSSAPVFIDDTLKNLTNSFLDIVNKYIPIQIYRPEVRSKVNCDVCGNKNTTEFGQTPDIQICEVCGTEKINYSTQTSYKDTDRINLSPKYKYRKSVHFRDKLNQYQGKQNKKFPSEIFADLESEFQKHNLLCEGSTYHERHKKILKEHIYIFLSISGHNDFYEDINYLHRHFTGIPCPDISTLEAELYEDFDRIINVINTFEDVERINGLNGDYLLYQLLRRRGIPVRETDFSILKTRDRLSEHDDIYNRVCQQLEWTFQPTV